MSLVATPHAPARAPWWRLILVGLSTLTGFVVVLAFAARCTADGSLAPPRQAPPPTDAGPPPVDRLAGIVSDAGPLEVESTPGEPWGPTPDAGPELAAAAATVDDAPLSLAELSALLGPALDRCLSEALRFDPSLGGPATLVVTLAPDVPAAVSLAPGSAASSTSLSRCLARVADVPPVPALALPVRVEVEVVLDGVAGAVRVNGARYAASAGNTDEP